MRIRRMEAWQRRIPRKIKKLLYGVRGRRSEVQEVRYRLDFLKIKKRYIPKEQLLT